MSLDRVCSAIRSCPSRGSIKPQFGMRHTGPIMVVSELIRGYVLSCIIWGTL